MASSMSAPTSSMGDDPVSPSATTVASDMFRVYTDPPTLHRSKRANPDPSLAAGMPLPLHLRHTFPKQLLGKPIDEFDPFYANKTTFVVVGHHWTIHRFDGEKSLFLMTPINPVRSAAITTVTHAAFHYFMFLVILSNVILYTNRRYYRFHPFYLLIFIIEMLIKVIAYGFLVKRFTYLRDPWNWIDFLVNMFGYLTMGMMVYTLIPLRFLRLVNFFTRSRPTFATSCGILLKMRDTLCWAGFSLFFYSVYFMAFYAGALWNRCIRDWTTGANFDEYNSSYWYSDKHGNDALCGMSSASVGCPPGYKCLSVYGENPDSGFTNFDNFFFSAMSILRLMTRDKWEALLAQVETVDGMWSIPNFLIVLVFGSFVLVNFIMAHVAIAHGQLLNILAEKKLSPDVKTESGADNDDHYWGREHEDASEMPSNVTVSAHYDKSDSQKREPELVIVIDKGEPSNANVAETKANPLAECCSTCFKFVCACKCCSRLQSFLSVVVFSRYFDWFICTAIVVNFIFVASYHYDTSYRYTFFKTFPYIYGIVLLIFIVEAILKILAMSPNRYFRDSWCIFEFIIIVLCCLRASGILIVFWFPVAIFRIFFIFRVASFAKLNGHFLQLLKLGCLNTYVLAVFVVAFGLLGYDLFFNPYRYPHHTLPDPYLGRLNFSDGWYSIILIVRVLCGQWSEAYWDCSRFSSPNSCLPYFFVIVILGSLLVINVFISMIMTSIRSHHLCDTDDDESAYLSLSDIAVSIQRLCPFRKQEQGTEKLPAAKSEEQLFDISLEGEATNNRHPELNINENAVAEQCCPASCNSRMPCCGSSSSFTPSPTPQDNASTKWQRVRNKALEISTHRFFHVAASLFIFIACGFQTLSSRWEALSNLVVCVAFSLELVLKLVGLGFRKYFSDGWNYFDFAVTTLHILSFPISLFVRLFHNRGLELLKSLRVLKLFSYHERLRVVIETVLFRFGHVVSAMLVSLLLWTIFAVIGVLCFSGSFHKCVDDHGERVQNMSSDIGPTHFYAAVRECDRRNFTWTNSYPNFDHLPNALIALLHLATMRGDLSILFNMMDASLIYSSPVQNASAGHALYVILFMVFGVLCCFACLFRALITKLNRQKRICGGYVETLMTAEQKLGYVELKKTFFKTPLKTIPEPDGGGWLMSALYRLVTSRTFSLVVFLVLLFNAAAMTLHYPSLNRRMYQSLNYIQLAFNIFFFVEIVLKLIAFRKHFFENSWYIYDFVVIVILLPVDTLLVGFFNPMFLDSGMLFRLLILLRLVRRIKCVRRISHNIWVSGAAYMNVLFVLLVVIFFFTRLGIGWFLVHNSIAFREGYVSGIDQLHNFLHFVPAFSTMTQMALGGLWNDIHAGLLTDPGSDNYEYVLRDCNRPKPSSFQVTLFVLSHLFICFIVIVHFAAVLLLEHYERLWKKMRLGITDQDLEDFAAAWRICDPYATGTISHENFAEFLAALPPTFKLEPPIDEAKIASLGVTPTLQEQRLTFDDVLLALLRSLDVDGSVFPSNPSKEQVQGVSKKQ